MKRPFTENSVNNRKIIIALCTASPRSIKDMAGIMGFTVNMLRHHVKNLVGWGHVKQFGTHTDKQGNASFIYLATELEYMPHIPLDAPEHIEKYIAENVRTQKDYNAPFIVTEGYKRTIYMEDFTRPTRRAPQKQNVWISNSLAMFDGA